MPYCSNIVDGPGRCPDHHTNGWQGANVDRCWTCRSMFMQAWGNYGTAWAVVHQWLGVGPDLGNGLVSFVPQIPPGQPSVRGQNIRLGDGSADVLATHVSHRYSVQIDVTGGVNADHVVIGYTLDRDTRPATVVLDGRTVHNYQVRQTNRGTEVTIATTAGHHTLSVTI